MDLKSIHSPKDIKNLSVDELPALADELRVALLKKLAAHGGHIGPNLGFLEATVALHYVFNAPEDKLVFDVSHQTYVHKMLTGRIDAFINPADYDKVTGFTSPDESPYDLFTIGHTSTSISLASGLAKARDLKAEDYNVVAVIGDGSLSGGEALEGLDSAAEAHSNFIVVVNDNDMSIAENHGGIYANLAELRATNGKSPDNFFRTLGYRYVYVGEGNDIPTLVAAFQAVKNTKHPVVVHIHTEKGHGYVPAVEHKEDFHFGAPFNLADGSPKNADDSLSYSDLFARYMLERIDRDPRTVVLTAGTPGVLSFGPEERAQAGKHFWDLGIAEQDAVGSAAGLAKGGMRPCFGVVSSFIQRAYDQLSQDVAINRLPVVINVFYGSIIGMTDVTHLGWFATPMIANIPNWVCLAPTNAEEYLAMLDWAMEQTENPVAVFVPGGGLVHSDRTLMKDFGSKRFETVRKGSKVAIVGVGSMLETALKAADILSTQGVNATVINPRIISELDEQTLQDLLQDHSLTVTVEETCTAGGFGEKVAAFYGSTAMHTLSLGAPKQFLDRYNIGKVLEQWSLTPATLAEQALTEITAADII
ncbi:MAG: 1-deoxy-D-xylulose-5-phosphate synthase [Bacteroides sp.]|nr:1-deoxy-D-xylulose-5-phosphate synthase [Bacteroides sp.]MCM1378920.1 1-deoxy-D-xylulose-5-phosphate synthase [Bacteroides sp.]MCM1445536.1 1-deoxy-D-xylulose-5-phosphate synthase [Prevotella sp.]